MRGLTKVGMVRDGRSRLGLDEAGNDRIEHGPARAQTRWDTVLVWFMRLAALAWLAKGLATWADILDIIPGGRPFASEPLGRQTVIVYLAVIDFAAAVGMWLTAAWGGVVWLLAATSAMTLAVLTPQLLPTPTILLVVEGSIVVLYFCLSWAAAREAQ